MAKERVQPIPKIQNLVVARYRDGRMVKGVTYDFGPQKRAFHLISTGAEGKEISSEVSLSELKAVFFVKSLEGRKGYPSTRGLLKEKAEPVVAIKVKVTFFDGETMEGTTHGYTPEREGFFIVPMEKDSNNLRIFIVSTAVKNIETWK
jgi:hypothetical protein